MTSQAESHPDPSDLPRDPDLPFFECDPVDDDFFQTAPRRWVNTVSLPCNPEQVFAVFEDAESWPQWVPGIRHVQWTSPEPFRPGTTRTVTLTGGIKVYEDFFAFDPPREMAFRFYGTSERIWRAFAERYRVRSTGPNQCELEWTVAFDTAAGWFGRLQPLLRPALTLTFKLYMRGLRRHCARAYPAA